MFSGPNPVFLLCTAKAMEDFQKLVPTKIDRWGHQIKHFGRIASGAVDQIKSSTEWKKRRDAILHTIGINLSSRYIPMVIEKLDALSESWKENEFINFSHEITSLTFDIITMILFGKDVRTKIGQINYTKTNGEIVQYDLMHYFHELVEDLEITSFQPINKVFPFLEAYELTVAHKALKSNIENLWSVLLDYLNHSDDKESVYHKIMSKFQSSNFTDVKNVVYDAKLVLMDMITFYIAGYDPISHALCSLLYNIKKNDHVFNKLSEEITEKYHIKDKHDYKSIRNTLDAFEYLPLVIKEALRFDNPAYFSLGYQALEDVTI